MKNTTSLHNITKNGEVSVEENKNSFDRFQDQDISNDQVPNIKPEAQNLIHDFISAFNNRSQLSAEAEAFIIDLVNILIDNNFAEPNFTINDYPGKDDGLPFEWWEDDNLIDENIDFNLDDDPNYQGLTEQEKLLVKIFPTQAYLMSKNKITATDETINRFGFNGRNDKSDSFRHAYFNALNTRSATFSVVGDGGEVVRLFGIAHESEVPIVLGMEITMDLHNNDQGIEFCSDCWPGLSTDIEISNGVWSLLQNGGLLYLDPLDLNLSPTYDSNGDGVQDCNACLNGIISETILKPTNL